MSRSPRFALDQLPFRLQNQIAAQLNRPAVAKQPVAKALPAPTPCVGPLAQVMQLGGLPVPVAELRFCPPRRWRFDYAWPEQKVALEVQGGIWNKGRHVRGAALLKEYEKLNNAAALGWRVLFVTPQQLLTAETLSFLRRALG